MSSEKDKEKPPKATIMDKLPFLKKLKNIKGIEIIVLVIFGLILLLICFGDGFSWTSGDGGTNDNPTSLSIMSSTEYIQKTEEKLSTLISQIKGAGKTKVMITVESGTEIVYAKTEITKKVGNDTTTTSTLILIDNNGTETPIVVMEILPKIKGVVIVSEGAKDVQTKLNIINATQTLLTLDVNKIQVYAGE